MARIHGVLAAREAARLLERDTLASLKAAVDPELSGDEYYAIVEAKSQKVQQQLTPILRALQFEGERGTEALVTALAHFRASDGAVTRGAPEEFLAPPERAALHADEESITNRGLTLEVSPPLVEGWPRVAVAGRPEYCDLVEKSELLNESDCCHVRVVVSGLQVGHRFKRVNAVYVVRPQQLLFQIRGHEERAL